MIHTSKQLKDKVRNISKGDNNIAKVLIRNFMMERFLERVSVSDYRDHIILKGGMLVAAIVGIDMRATMDIDASVKSLPVNEDDAQRIVSEIYPFMAVWKVFTFILFLSEIKSQIHRSLSYTLTIFPLVEGTVHTPRL